MGRVSVDNKCNRSFQWVVERIPNGWDWCLILTIYIQFYWNHNYFFRYANVDFVISFSSIEHSGLGRYGDPIDPNGDLHELRKIHCLLKPGGLLFLALPCSIDTVYFNAHRTYGYIRLPMIMAGFDYIGSFYANSPRMNKDFPVIRPEENYKHYLFVLKKSP